MAKKGVGLAKDIVSTGWVLDGNSAIWQPCSIMCAELF